MPILFEFGKEEKIKEPKLLRALLEKLWAFFKSSSDFPTQEEEDSVVKKQPFLSFDGEMIRARNYVGFVQHNNEIVEIYPKVFRDITTGCPKALMLQHLFFWFNYCRRWKFPFSSANLDLKSVPDFPELITYLIANQFYEAISQRPLSMYQAIEEVLESPKGRINFNQYITKRIARGQFHKIDCEHEPFVFDNKVNRAIKFCSKLLLERTRFSECHRILVDVLFLLEEVEDVQLTIADFNNIKINPFFDEYQNLLNSCRMILEQSLYSSESADLSQWCLLFPMEYVFEDFLAGFVERHLSKDWCVEYQKSEMYLATNSKSENVFNMKHDMFLTSKKDEEIKIIVDAKYKLRTKADLKEKKKGISQSDLYQVVSYALRRGCSDVFIIYPNTTEEISEPDTFIVKSGFGGNEEIMVTAIEIPFWSIGDMANLEDALKLKLKSAFDKVLTSRLKAA